MELLGILVIGLVFGFGFRWGTKSQDFAHKMTDDAIEAAAEGVSSCWSSFKHKQSPKPKSHWRRPEAKQPWETVQ